MLAAPTEFSDFLLDAVDLLLAFYSLIDQLFLLATSVVPTSHQYFDFIFEMALERDELSSLDRFS